MPYAIRKKGEKFLVVNTQTGKTKGTHESKERAQKQLNLLRGIKYSAWRPTRR